MAQEEKNLFAPHYAGYLGSNLDEAKKLLEKVVKFAPTCKVRYDIASYVMMANKDDGDDILIGFFIILTFFFILRQINNASCNRNSSNSLLSDTFVLFVILQHL